MVRRILDEMKKLKEQNIKLFENNEKLTIEVQLLKTIMDDLKQKSLGKAIEIVDTITITISSNADGNL